MLAQAQAGGASWWADNGGICHLACGGATTWAGFAEAILAAAGSRCRVAPVSTAEFPTLATRPRNSVLDTTRLGARFCRIPEWREALRLCMA
jgi:dTDP-4-dehydrorhamnose reductase